MRKLVVVAMISGVVIVGGGLLFQYANTPQAESHLEVSSLEAGTRIVRDEKGMPYIFGSNLHDGFIAQGFVTAQDRIFQMSISRLLVQGRLSEVFGNVALDTDKLIRTLGIRRAAEKHWKLLGDKEKAIFNAYAAGVNYFVDEYSDDLPIELKLAGIPVIQWTPIDSLSILYFMAWQSSANLQSEILSQALLEKVGPERYSSLEPLHNSIANAKNIQSKSKSMQIPRAAYAQRNWLGLSSLFDSIPTMRHGIGSNNWALSGEITASGKPLVANDPHLKAGLLASYLYPFGMFVGEVEVVGAVIPGIPSVLVCSGQVKLATAL